MQMRYLLRKGMAADLSGIDGYTLPSRLLKIYTVFAEPFNSILSEGQPNLLARNSISIISGGLIKIYLLNSTTLKLRLNIFKHKYQASAAHMLQANYQVLKIV